MYLHCLHKIDAVIISFECIFKFINWSRLVGVQTIWTYTIFKLILKISSSTWNFIQREYKISVDNGQSFRSNFFTYYRVYTLKHCEIILLHSYINYYTKYLIWCYGYNFYRFQWPNSHYTGWPKCPIGN